jgi:hypothetical protein
VRRQADGACWHARKCLQHAPSFVLRHLLGLQLALPVSPPDLQARVTLQIQPMHLLPNKCGRSSRKARHQKSCTRRAHDGGPVFACQRADELGV